MISAPGMMIEPTENPPNWVRSRGYRMPRQPLPIGTAGNINTRALVNGRWIAGRAVPEDVKPDRWRAYCNYRGDDGHTRKVERTGATENKAKTLLKTALKELDGGTNLSAASRFKHVAEQWIDGIQRHKSGTTYDRYRGRLDKHILPALGELLIRECTAGRLKKFIDSLERNGLEAATLRGIKTVLSGVMQEAVNEEIIDANPVRHMPKIEGGRRKKVQAYDSEQLLDFFAGIDGDEESVRADLPDYIRFLFGTGVRFGEALAVRWRDLNLTDEPVRAVDAWGEQVRIPPRSVWVNGNIVDVRGKGLVRNDGKTFKSNRIIKLPDYLFTLLLVRKPVGAPLDEPVFPSSAFGWRHPCNVQRSVRRLRERIGYPDFTTHIGRRSVATALDEAGHSAREIADVLGHAKPSMTQDHYMARGRENAAAAATLDQIHRPK